jgi:quercetin dioxygenase-like cupin family protein
MDIFKDQHDSSPDPCQLKFPRPTPFAMKILTLICCLVIPVAWNLNAAEAPKSVTNSTVIDWAKLAVKPTKTGERRELFDAPTLTLNNFEGHVTTIRPGEVPHPPHRHPDEEMILIKEGTLEVTINGETQRASTGSVFFYASNDLHGMRNVGSTPATYYVFRFVTAKTPPPAARP